MASAHETENTGIGLIPQPETSAPIEKDGKLYDTLSASLSTNGIKHELTVLVPRGEGETVLRLYTRYSSDEIGYSKIEPMSPDNALVLKEALEKPTNKELIEIFRSSKIDPETAVELLSRAVEILPTAAKHAHRGEISLEEVMELSKT